MYVVHWARLFCCLSCHVVVFLSVFYSFASIYILFIIFMHEIMNFSYIFSSSFTRFIYCSHSVIQKWQHCLYIKHHRRHVMQFQKLCALCSSANLYSWLLAVSKEWGREQSYNQFTNKTRKTNIIRITRDSPPNNVDFSIILFFVLYTMQPHKRRECSMAILNKLEQCRTMHQWVVINYFNLVFSASLFGCWAIWQGLLMLMFKQNGSRCF